MRRVGRYGVFGVGEMVGWIVVWRVGWIVVCAVGSEAGAGVTLVVGWQAARSRINVMRNT
jgi:hypothetical protein